MGKRESKALQGARLQLQNLPGDAMDGGKRPAVFLTFEPKAASCKHGCRVGSKKTSLGKPRLQPLQAACMVRCSLLFIRFLGH